MCESGDESLREFDAHCVHVIGATVTAASSGLCRVAVRGGNVTVAT